MTRFVLAAFWACSATLLSAQHEETTLPVNISDDLPSHHVLGMSTPVNTDQDGATNVWLNLLSKQHQRVQTSGVLQATENGGWALEDADLIDDNSAPTTVQLLDFQAGSIQPNTPLQVTGRLRLQTTKHGIPELALSKVIVMQVGHPSVEISWDTLATTFVDKYIEALDAYYWQPEFEDHVLALDGTEISICGYHTYVDFNSDFAILIRDDAQFSWCCPTIEPDEAMDLRMGANQPKIANGVWVRATGKLELNVEDLYQMNYILHVHSITATDGSPLDDRYLYNSKD